MRIDINEPQAVEKFWEGMHDVAAAATRYQDDDLYVALVKIGRSALAQGVELVPAGGLFLRCPACDAVPGQHCVNVPGSPLNGHALHRQRVELVDKVLAGTVPLPDPLG
ncbi:hypothetical protein AB0B85_03445 [Micromonospora sp. NPDC049044]|uniref:zinc finger domain-containing protein n=1 Tax=unclassified Micromonospora TaxID=2617518 RepID=UPI00340AAD1C